MDLCTDRHATAYLEPRPLSVKIHSVSLVTSRVKLYELASRLHWILTMLTGQQCHRIACTTVLHQSPFITREIYVATNDQD